MRRLKILAIDDEPALLSIIKLSLESNYDVSLAGSVKDAFAIMLDRKPDLILVDNIMPGFNGLEFVSTIRSAGNTKGIPIIMLTALKEPADRIDAYKAGVDDFISKPFNPEELLVRVEARLERLNVVKNPTVSARSIGNLSMDIKNRDLRINGEPIRLTQVELTILEKLVSEKNQVVKRETLENIIWNDKKPEARILDIHIATLRRKLKKFSHKIETVYGVGYTIRSNDS